MILALIVLLVASVFITVMYAASTFSNALGGGSWFPRFLVTLLCFAATLVILDALNWITLK